MGHIDQFLAASARVCWNVASEVASPRIISTSFIAGTGFMKCIPITRSARDVRAPILVIEIDDVFEAIDGDALLESSLRKRLRGRETIADDREVQRLFRYLLAQGFESDQVMQALRAKRRPR